ncbi:hypothetical protein B0H14DRAFT_2652949 [Mycena olivaceomarginata]|nr:hypothetical protein B0H14DRAFT_2652949 [Mycena olivaceomarginata]
MRNVQGAGMYIWEIQQGKTKKMGRREQTPEELMGGQMPGREWERSDGRKMPWALMEGEIPGRERERSEEWKMPRGLMKRANPGARAGEVGRKENAAGMDGEAIPGGIDGRENAGKQSEKTRKNLKGMEISQDQSHQKKKQEAPSGMDEWGHFRVFLGPKNHFFRQARQPWTQCNVQSLHPNQHITVEAEVQKAGGCISKLEKQIKLQELVPAIRGHDKRWDQSEMSKGLCIWGTRIIPPDPPVELNEIL